MNPDLSKWTINLSESDQPTEPADPDLDPQVIVSGNTVHMLWTARNADWSGYKLYYRRSTDSGKTWKTKVLLMSDPDNLTSNAERRMAVDGNIIHIFQRNYGTPPAAGCVWNGVLTYFRSTDNGATFETPRDIIYADAPNCYWHVENIYASASGGKVAVGYRYRKNDGPYTDIIGLLTSSDNGTIFTPHTAMQNDDDLILDDMVMNGDKIYMAVRHIHGYLNGGYDTASDLYVASSTNLGSTFVNKLVSVPSNVLDGNGTGVHKTNTLQDYHYSSNIAAAGNTVSIVWSGVDSTGTTCLFYRRSTNSGTSFEAVKNLSKPVLPAGRVPRWGLETIAAKGDFVYIVFVEDGTKRILFRSSSDGGANFAGLKELSKEGYKHIADGWWPVMTSDPADATGATVHVFWTGPRYVVSTNGGASFTNPVMVSNNFTLSAYDRPQMAVGMDGIVYFTGEGINRAGYDSDIFYRRFNPVAPAPSATNRAMNFHTEFLNSDGFLGIKDNMQVKATADTNFKSAMTLDAWVKVNRDSNVPGYFVYKADPAAYSPEGAWGSYMLGQWSNGSVDARIVTTDGTTPTGHVLVAGDPVPNGVWTHIAMSYSASGGPNNFKIYVNGNLVGSKTVTGNLATGPGILFIGGDDSNRYSPYSAADVNDVTIDDLRLWNRALTQAEIKQYMSGVTGTESGLRAYYNFNGTTMDITGHGNDGVLMYEETYVNGQAAPAAPSGLLAKATSEKQIVLTWTDKSNGEAGFEIERASGNCASATSWTTISSVGPDTTTYTSTGLTANTAYAYRVNSYNSSDSAYSNCASATTGVSGSPGAPSNLSAVSTSSSNINLTWKDNSSGETSFKVYRKKGTGAWTFLKTTAADAVSYTDTGAAGNEATDIYSYQVKGCVGTVCSPPTHPAVVPFKPTGLSNGGISVEFVRLVWTDGSTDETGFQIYRKDGSCSAGGTWTLIGTTGANAVSYKDATVSASSPYSYKLRAYTQSEGQPFAKGYSNYTSCLPVTTKPIACGDGLCNTGEAVTCPADCAP